MARKPSERSHRKKEAEQELNLAPIMALICILIPALIFVFQFYEITVQSVAAPKLGPKSSQKDDDKDDKPPLNLTVLISDKGFVLKWSDELAGEGGEPPRIPKKIFKDEAGDQFEDYDYPRLYAEVVAKKKAYPDEDTINLGADFAIPWQTVARTIDCVRVRLAKTCPTKQNKRAPCEGTDARQDVFSTLQEYIMAPAYIPPKSKSEKSENSMEEARQEPLFPKVVFVVAE